MRRAMLIPLAATGIAGLVAGCGSSSKTSSSSSSKASSLYGAPPAASAQASSAPASTPVVITTKQTKLGTIVGAGPKQLTVYLFEGDKGAASSCSGACAAAWPPVIGKPQATGAAQSAALGTITRSDGSTQVTYGGHPLYYFVKDGDHSDAYGQALKAFGADWYVLTPSGKKLDKS